MKKRRRGRGSRCSRASGSPRRPRRACRSDRGAGDEHRQRREHERCAQDGPDADGLRARTAYRRRGDGPTIAMTGISVSGIAVATAARTLPTAPSARSRMPEPLDPVREELGGEEDDASETTSRTISTDALVAPRWPYGPKVSPDHRAGGRRHRAGPARRPDDGACQGTTPSGAECRRAKLQRQRTRQPSRHRAGRRRCRGEATGGCCGAYGRSATCRARLARSSACAGAGRRCPSCGAARSSRARSGIGGGG